MCMQTRWVHTVLVIVQNQLQFFVIADHCCWPRELQLFIRLTTTDAGMTTNYSIARVPASAGLRAGMSPLPGGS